MNLTKAFYCGPNPEVKFGGVTYKAVPTILQYEDTPLIEISSKVDLGTTTAISIFHKDGTYLAKAIGNRLYLTESGEKCNLKLRHPSGLTVCELDESTLFEVRRTGASALAIDSELYSPSGRFIAVKSSDRKIFTKFEENSTTIESLSMENIGISNFKIAVLVHNDGRIDFCVF